MAKKETIKKCKPFVKWAGGKTRLAPTIDKYMPRNIADYDNLVYIDPFVGAGGMLFYMLQHYSNITTVIANDINEDLINAYSMIKYKPDLVVEILKDLEATYRQMPDDDSRRKLFERKKTLFNNRDLYGNVERAAIFIFLNKTCFNGMYRVNKKGDFNVPFGRYTNPTICDEDMIRRDSELLQNVCFMTCDYRDVLELAIEYKNAGRHVVCYIDPPYRPVSKTSCFMNYTNVPFGDDEQRRLADMCKKMDYAGVEFLLSNSDGYSVNPKDTFMMDLYHKFNITHVMSSRMLNSKADGRGKVPELLVWNYNATKE